MLAGQQQRHGAQRAQAAEASRTHQFKQAVVDAGAGRDRHAAGIACGIQARRKQDLTLVQQVVVGAYLHGVQAQMADLGERGPQIARHAAQPSRGGVGARADGRVEPGGQAGHEQVLALLDLHLPEIHASSRGAQAVAQRGAPVQMAQAQCQRQIIAGAAGQQGQFELACVQGGQELMHGAVAPCHDDAAARRQAHQVRPGASHVVGHDQRHLRMRLQGARQGLTQRSAAPPGRVRVEQA